MKTNFKLVSFVGLVILAMSIFAEPVITERNQQFRVWENIQAAGRIGTIDGTGNVTFGPRIQISSASFPVDGVGEEAAD
jgi:hypothetical protein